MTCKTQAELQDSTGEQVPFEKRWHSHSTVICTDWATVEHTALTHQFQCTKYLNTCKTQNHSSNEEKKKWPGKTSLPLHAQIELDSAAKRRRLRPSRERANFSPQRNLRLPEKRVKKELFPAKPNIQLASSHDVVTVPMRSNNSDLQKTIKFARQYWTTITSTLREALAQPFSNAICTDWMAQHKRIATRYCRTHRFDAPVSILFQCTKYLNTCETQKHSSNEEKKKWPGNISSTALAHRAGFGRQKRQHLRQPRARANFSPQQNLRLTEKNTRFRANPILQIAPHDVAISMRSANNDPQNTKQNRKTVLEN